jgi:hypothetical protein
MRWLVVGVALCALPAYAGSSPATVQRAVGAAVPYSVGRALPDRSGEWTRAPQVQMFNPGDLWEHINGAAEQYLTYGFQDLATSRYTDATTRATAVAEVYRMSDAAGAFGIYRQELNPKAKAVPVGVEGRAGTNTVRFWTSTFYVKLATTPGGGTPALEALGAAIAKGLGAPGGMPEQVGWFPAAGQLPDSVRYIPADALGQASFANAFEAKYENAGEPSTALVVPFGGEQAAASALARYESFLARAKNRSKVASPGDGGFSAVDSFLGPILAVRAGSRLVISVGASDERVAAARLTEIIARMSRAPAGPFRKDGAS